KMSKSLGNGIDPLEVIDQYGADALRFMLTTGITPGNDMRYQIDKLESSRNFANKLWNASRFVIMNLQDEDGNFKEMAKCCGDCCGMACGDTTNFSNIALKDEDKWIISKVNDAVKYVTSSLDKFDLALAGQRVYELTWNEYCDWYIEIVKQRLWGDDEEDKKVVRFVLVMVLKNVLEMLHPFMPYITEEIWSFLPHSNCEREDNPDCFLIKAKWPEFSENRQFVKEEAKLEMAMEAIRAIRNIRAEAEAAPSRKLRAVILAKGENLESIKAGERYIKNLANITDITFVTDKKEVPEDVMSAVINGVEIFVPLDDLVDFGAEFDRLTKEKKRLEGEVARVKGKLSNPGFVSKAPEAVINEEKEKQDKYQDMLIKVIDRLEGVSKKLNK
ncbi:MAG: class I tRNA ligase family protein, partial [Anaerovoracaceae bacterium]